MGSVALASPEPRRVMYYCHDTYGLGHIRRTLALTGYLCGHMPGVSQLIVTGSPVAHGFTLPCCADYVKLPAVTKVAAGEYESRSLAIPFERTQAMRGEILLSAARNFQPHALVVDHAPVGLKGEVLPTLRYLKEFSPDTYLVVGLRDVVDGPQQVRKAWLREGVYDALDDLYDLIVVYGQEDVNDVVGEYGLSPRAAAKTRYVGYLRREPGPRTPGQVRAELGLLTDKLVVVMAGGGGDGYEIFRAALGALALRRGPADFDCLLVGGPLMSAEHREELLELARGGDGVHFLEFTEDMASYIQAADAVVSMGGYNSVCETLSLGRPVLIVPRVAPRQEQLVRAEALARRGLVRMLHPDELSPRRMLEEIRELLERPPVPRAPLEMDGLPRFAEEMDRILPRHTPTGHALAPQEVR